MKKMKKGFTIVELVIVIGVIAILSAVLIPTFVNLSSKAKEATAKQEVSDGYTAYVVAKTEAGDLPKGQTEVAIKRHNGTEVLTYTYVDGEWKNAGSSSGDPLYGDLDSDKTVDKGEVVVYLKA